jgi:pyruvate/2-oxoglutarate/acetoin dehydrogenase E1 component
MKLTYREALRESLREALLKNNKVFLIGEDIGAYGGAYAVSKGFLQEFGPQRIRDAPLSESTFVGAGIGAALCGLRPIVEIMTINFSLLALDQIINSAAILRHMSGGQFTVPLIIRMTTGGGRQLAAQHSHSFEGWYAHIPGLKILTPGTVQDARYMLGEALKDENPVLIFEHAMLFNREEDLVESSVNYSANKTLCLNEGNQLTIVTYGGMVYKCLQAAAQLKSQNYSIEVLDLRILRPLDLEPVLTSLKKTKKVLIVDEGWRSGSISGEISARLMEQAFSELQKPVQRLCRQEVPIPYAKHLEDAAIPQVTDIVLAAKEMLI